MFEFIVSHTQNTFAAGVAFVVLLLLYAFASYGTWTLGAYLRDPEEDPTRDEYILGTFMVWTCLLWPVWAVILVGRAIIMYLKDLYLWLVMKASRGEANDPVIEVIVRNAPEPDWMDVPKVPDAPAAPDAPTVQDAEIVPAEPDHVHLHDIEEKIEVALSDVVGKELDKCTEPACVICRPSEEPEPAPLPKKRKVSRRPKKCPTKSRVTIPPPNKAGRRRTYAGQPIAE